MAPIISLFNHKGGVSKTTSTFNLGWAIANSGKRVLIVDGDPQCNLTGTVLDFAGISDFADFYDRNPKSDINSCLQPVFSGSGSPLTAANITDTPNPNLFLLVGNIALAENETQISVALSTSSAIRALQNIPGAVCQLLRLTAAENQIDLVIVDMSPSVGALNQCFLMGSDYFVIPTSPDFYCFQAIGSLARVLPRWNSEVSAFRSPDLLYPFPAAPPKFCGIISQRYRPRGGNPAKSFQNWIDTIKLSVIQELVPVLMSNGMCITVPEFNSAAPQDTPFNLANIADFNSLIAQSQKFNTPIFALSDDQIEQGGFVLQNMITSRNEFNRVFAALANTIEIIVGTRKKPKMKRGL